MKQPVILDKATALKRLSSLIEHPALQRITEALGPHASLHLVGGSVRDVLLGGEALDIDLATSQLPEVIEDLLLRANFRVIDTGKERGTLLVVVPGMPKIEITTFRAPSGRNESAYSDSIEEDLAGRDFTVNALAYAMELGNLIDPYGGAEDLARGLLRCVANAADRFAEDPLRVLRMLRFGPGQGRDVVDETCAAAAVYGNRLASVSPERVRDELERILLSPNPGAALRMARNLGLLEHFLPELLPSVGFEQNRFHYQDVFEHTLTVLENTPPRIEMRLAALFHDAGKPHTLSLDTDGERHFYQHETVSESIAQSVMERLHFGREPISLVCMLVRQHMRSIDCGPAGARRIMRDTSPWYDEWRQFKVADAPPGESSDVFKARLRRFDELISSERSRLNGGLIEPLVINGNDLLSAGFSEGPDLGKCLKQLRELIIEDPGLNERDFLLARAVEMLKSSRSD